MFLPNLLIFEDSLAWCEKICDTWHFSSLGDELHIRSHLFRKKSDCNFVLQSSALLLKPLWLVHAWQPELRINKQSIYHRISMNGMFTYTCHKNQPIVGKYTIHGSYGFLWYVICLSQLGWLKEILKAACIAHFRVFPCLNKAKVSSNSKALGELLCKQMKITQFITQKWLSHTIHVWCIYPQLLDVSGKWKKIYRALLHWSCGLSNLHHIYLTLSNFWSIHLDLPNHPEREASVRKSLPQRRRHKAIYINKYIYIYICIYICISIW